MASAVCFQWVTAISNDFGVWIINFGFLGAPGVFLLWAVVAVIRIFPRQGSSVWSWRE